VSQRLTTGLSPHIKSPQSVAKVMWAVSIALIPAFVASVTFFGPRALAVLAVGVLSCVLTEAFIQAFMLKKPVTISDGSAVVTGLLLAFNIPVSIPLWMVAVGGFVAIGIAKMAFGGIGNNPFNPALVGRAFMATSFAAPMTNWRLPLVFDGATGATPLGIIAKASETGMAALQSELPGYLNMFIGNIGGSLGETSALAIVLGGIFLIARGLIDWRTPLFFLGSLAAFTGIFWVISPSSYADPLFHVLAGGAMLGAWFMATDMTTSPMSRNGRIVFAVGAGLLTGVIRLFGALPGGVSYGILIMNALVPAIDSHIRPKRFAQGALHEKT